MPLLRSLNFKKLAWCYKYFVPTGLSESVQDFAPGECNLLEVLQNKNL
jgi:hypothetical protein